MNALMRSVRARAAGARAAACPPRALLAGLLVAAGALGGCGSSHRPTPSAATVRGSVVSRARCERNTAAGPITFVSPFSYDASAGIMDVFMARKLGYFRELCLTVDINAASFTGEELVSADRAQVTGIGSAADAMLAAAGGAHVTAVATYGDTDPHVILTNAKITRLTQLEGGTLGYYTNITPGALQMLTDAGVDISKVRFVKLTSYDPSIVTRGQIDGLIGYASNEGTAFKDAGRPYHAFYPAQYGVKGTYNVMQFNTSWLHAHPAVAADFMRADLRALAYCMRHKAACVNYLARQARANHQGVAFPKRLETSIWKIESRFVEDAPRPWGSQTLAEWRPEYRLVRRYGHQAGLTSTDTLPPLASMMDTTLVPSLYHGDTLIWPGS